MICRIEDIKNISNTLLLAVDNKEISTVTDTLELSVKDSILYLSITNREYFVKSILPIYDDIEFHASVEAITFLKLISQITTDIIEFNIKENYLVIKANGTYKLPLIYDDDKILELPEIKINNVVEEFDIDGNILYSILINNSRQLNTGVIFKPIQKMFYVDEKGAITFTSGACVNNFTLEKPVKLLFNNKLVKLFKLFKSKKVHFKLGYDKISNDITQTKVYFESDDVIITSILFCDESMINSVPVTAIRNRANFDYPYSVCINTNNFIQLINRISIFNDKKNIDSCCSFEFDSSNLTVSSKNNSSTEVLSFEDNLNIDNIYNADLNINELKNILDSCSNQFINLKFGDNQAIIIQDYNVTYVIPEVHIE